ncbi:MAG: hypothetical protein IT578_04505 [Verrucomicrobiae bacterium]|nr:hypothetical protein [Verrucomicrobiae bacterium]
MSTKPSAQEAAGYSFGKPPDDMEAWREQCRRQMKRSTLFRMKHGWCYTHKPVLDDAPYRIFNSTAEYRAWCRENLPAYLGFHDQSEAV